MNGRRGCGVAKATGRCVLGAVAVALVMLLGAPLSGATYEVYTGISAEMKHECTETCPGPVTRTTVGICETVRCEIINFVDKDKKITSAGDEFPNDSLGNVYWHTEVGGSCFPLQGRSTVFTAPYEGPTCCVQAEVHDSHEMADDPALWLQVLFYVVAPNGVTPTFEEDRPLGVEGPPNNKVGAWSRFYLQIVPATVSFRWVRFRENIAYQWEWWPNMTINDVEQQSYTISARPCVVGGTLIPNVGGDDCSTGRYPISVLDDGTGYQPAFYAWDAPMEFYNGLEWTQFYLKINVDFYDEFDQSCVTGIWAVGSAFGTPQGPWQ